MKTSVPIIALLVIAFLAVPAMGGDEAPPRKAFYEAAIDDEIAQCRQMASLRASRSANLRMKGHREASKALFLETHRDQLVERMIASNLEPKPYKVQRFLNDRFCCTCYAKWTAQSDL